MTTSNIRMPPLACEAMTDAQSAAADELIAGTRKGVKGPFIALLRSLELMARWQKVGEYLRFGSQVPPRLSEFADRTVSRVTWVTELFTQAALRARRFTAETVAATLLPAAALTNCVERASIFSATLLTATTAGTAATAILFSA